MIKSWMNAAKEDHEEKNRVSSFRGYLYKLRRSPNLLAPQWGKRWFSIEAHFLKWYRHESDLCASGMVDLKYVRKITKADTYGTTTFTIICEERTLVLKCANAGEMNNWIRALHKQADIARGGSGMTVVSDFNQFPLNSSSIKYSRKHGKSKTSLTLEEELDLTLKKLTELEITVQQEDENSEKLNRRPSKNKKLLDIHADSDNSTEYVKKDNSKSRTIRLEESKFDDDDQFEENENVPIRFGGNIARHRNSLNAPQTTGNQISNPAKQSQSHNSNINNKSTTIERMASNSSIEELQLGNSMYNKARNTTKSRSLNQRDLYDKDDMDMKSLEDDSPVQLRVRQSSNNTNNNNGNNHLKNNSGDEFDVNDQPASRQQFGAKSRSNSTNNNNNNNPGKSKIASRIESTESLDFVEENPQYAGSTKYEYQYRGNYIEQVPTTTTTTTKKRNSNGNNSSSNVATSNLGNTHNNQQQNIPSTTLRGSKAFVGLKSAWTDD
jgi:hypothetical protein